MVFCPYHFVRTPFLVISLILLLNHSKIAASTTAQTGNVFWPFFHQSLYIFSTFFGVHPSFPLSHFKMYNCNFTAAILQLKIAFYNCRNCHQLHVKICPGTRQANANIETPIMPFAGWCWRPTTGWRPSKQMMRASGLETLNADGEVSDWRPSEQILRASGLGAIKTDGAGIGAEDHQGRRRRHRGWRPSW